MAIPVFYRPQTAAAAVRPQLGANHKSYGDSGSGGVMAWLNRPARSSRRRVVAFLVAFLPAAAAGLVYVYSQPPEYRAVARLQISPAATVAQATDAKDAPAVVTDAKSFLTEVQVLTSRPLLQDVIARLKRRGELPDLAPDPVTAAQAMLHAEPIAGTQIVELSAAGPHQRLVSHIVNTIAEAYQQRVADAYKGLATHTDGEVADELKALEAKIAVKRDSVNAFRNQYDIVSMEHKENDVLADIEGLSQSYTLANERLEKAKGRLDALRTGKAVIRAKDDPTLADLQQRVSVLREQWHEMEGRFTPAYLALDADAKALQARLANLEDQLKAQIGASQQTAAAEAQQEMVAAQAAAARLRQDVATNQKQAQEFATHLNDYKAMREDLDHLEGMHRAALDQLAKLQASEAERAPRVQLVEAAAESRQPWRPDYQLEAALALAGAVAFGLFAAWFVDFIAGAPAPPVPAFVHYAWAPALLDSEDELPPRSLAAPADFARLPAPAPPPRELTDAEIGALVVAATENARLIAIALLIGLTAAEIIALRWEDIDFTAIRVGGAEARTLPLDEPMLALLTARHRQAAAAGNILQKPDGGAFTDDEVTRLILFAAYDAGLDRPQQVTPQALRYTFICYLLRQGIRAADIDPIVGRVPPAELIAYMQLNSPAARRPIEDIERVLPALREIAAAGAG
jgi:polysaccharide biosynthesis transport protein